MRAHLPRRSLVAVTTIAVTATLALAPILPADSLGRSSKHTSSTADDDLVTTLDQVLAGSALTGSTTSVQVLDQATGTEVYSRNADQRLIPGSNEKLLTSAAVLDELGPDYRFHTTVSHTGSRRGTTVTGDLILQGNGDPTLTEARFDALAEKVAAAGITRVKGRLIADDSAFDHTLLGTDWAWDDEPYSYAAPISALTAAATSVFDTGSVAVTTRPGATVGAAAVLTQTPRNAYVKFRNQAVTGVAGSANTISVDRLHNTNTVVVSGSIPLGGSAGTDLATVEDPTLLAAAAFRAALSRHHVRVTGRTVIKASTGPITPIYELASIPLGELLVPFLKLSNNGHAELLIKALGHESTGEAGTWTNGLSRAETLLADLGVTVPAVTLTDASGLSRRDLLTTRQIANLLETAKSEPWFDSWYHALPIAGASGSLVGGTLTNRFRGTPAANNLRAKTGTLTGVNALSGYVTDSTGRGLVFSMVSNNATANVAGILDQAGVTLANAGSASVSATTVAPKTRRALTPAGQDGECSWVQAC
jgi:D-alanyl-D-alanine carboxypeptidase/D-alanyl-D-alanine-endopeptidase (penicillin-binding protein 4)